MKLIAVRTKDLPETLQRHITSQSVNVIITETVELQSTQWDGGSRNSYSWVDLATGKDMPIVDTRPWPQNMGPMGPMPIVPGTVVLKSGTFMGKPASIYIYANACDISPQIEKPAPTLTHIQRQVLKCCASYNAKGKKRFRDDANMSDCKWTSVVTDLQEMKLLDNRKSITVEGRNVADKISDLILNPYSEQFKGKED